MQVSFFTNHLTQQKRSLLLVLFIFLCAPIQAQLHIGLFGDLNNNTTCYNRGYLGKYPEEIESQLDSPTPMIKGGGYLCLRYDLSHWFAIRTDLEMLGLSSRVRTVSYKSGNVINMGYTTDTISLLTWPVMGCIYYQFGNSQVFQVYECAGIYGSYLVKELQDSIKDYDFGFVNCLGIVYNFYKKWSVATEAKCYRGFINQHHTGSKYFKQPIYNSWFGISVGITYSFDFNND